MQREPLVACVMLTKDRPELAWRAIECFRAQTYKHRTLLIWNTGTSEEIECGCGSLCFHAVAPDEGLTIGALRNAANAFRTGYGVPDILIHWDDDDWSHPNRIAEQVALLQNSRADVVGYNEMLFWRSVLDSRGHPGEAWLYRKRSNTYALGTSLCYWRRVWEAKKFPDLPRPGAGAASEDREWSQGLNVRAVSSLVVPYEKPDGPRMIARIHGANSMPYNIEQTIEDGGIEWSRAAEWDERIREILK